MGDLGKLFATGPGVLAELRPGSRLWYWLLSGLYLGHGMVGAQERITELGQELLRTRPEPAARVLCMEALSFMTGLGVYSGDRQRTSAFLAYLIELGAAANGPEAVMERAWTLFARGLFSVFFEAKPWQSHVWLEQGCRELFEVGLERPALAARLIWAQALVGLGDRASAEAQLREFLAQSQRSRLFPMVLQGQLNLALFLAGSAEPAQREEARALADTQQFEGPRLFTGQARTLKAKVAANGGDLAGAETWAREACEVLAPFLMHQCLPRMLLSEVLRAQGRASEAREVAALGVRQLERCESQGAETVGLLLALTEACLAEGDTEAGEAALRRGLQCLGARAEDIPDAAIRERFLHQVPENARTLELARQRWGETKA
jgi:hypothetical protein